MSARNVWMSLMIGLLVFVVVGFVLDLQGWGRVLLAIVTAALVLGVPRTRAWCTIAHADCRICGRHEARFWMVDGLCDGECMAFELLLPIVPEVVEPGIAEKRLRIAAEIRH